MSATPALPGSIAYLNKRHRQQWPAELLQEREPVYIHNTFDKVHHVPLGSLRNWIIPACPKDKQYVTLKVPGLIKDEYDTGDGNGNMGANPVLGETVAAEIVGNGMQAQLKELGMHTNNKEWWGVFWSKNEIPTQAELDTAKDKLTRFMRILFDDGNRRAMEGHTDKAGMGINSIGANNHMAAKFLGQSPDWSRATNVMIDCPNCGERVKPGIIQHKECGWVLDPVRFAANQAAIQAAKEQAETPKRQGQGARG